VSADRRRAPFVVAHRGGAAEAPENSIEAFRRAIDRGFPYAECDVRPLKDGTPVVVHDETVVLKGRAGLRFVRETTAEEWREADLAATLGRPDAVLPPPFLSDLLALPRRGLRFMIEIKPGGDAAGDEVFGARVAADAAAALPLDAFVLASFSPAVLKGALDAAPSAARMALLDVGDSEDAFDGLGASSVGVALGVATPEFTARMHARGLAVWSWTVKDLRQAATLVEASVEGLISDIPSAVTAWLLGENSKNGGV
jgi:glycerophosphoryl diester phosphodiesterase